MPEPHLIRPVQPADDPAVAAVIRAVMPEFGADGPGFAIHDPEVDHMTEAYTKPGAAYFVLEVAGRVIGGAGVAALEGGPEGICELKKMYFLAEARGHGFGEEMIRHCLRTAKTLGYRTCYLETLSGMTAAMGLYAKVGFTPLGSPLGATGHHGCDHWYSLELA